MDSLCSNCNNFYANSEGLCSSCLKLAQLKKESQEAVEELLLSAETIGKGMNSSKSSSDRCGQCDRRLNLIAFRCRCNQSFCPKHRLPELHMCQFDHVSDGKRKLSESNPQVIASKVTRF